MGLGVGSSVGTTLGGGATRGVGSSDEGGNSTLGGGCNSIGMGCTPSGEFTRGMGGLYGSRSVVSGGVGMGGDSVARCSICAMCIYALLIGEPYSSVGTSGVVERFVLRMLTRSVAA